MFFLEIITMPKLTRSELVSEKSLFAEYTYKCDKHIDCQYEMRITTFSGKRITKPWIPSESGEHSEDQTSIQLKRGINPIFLPLIESEIERNTVPKTSWNLLGRKRGQMMSLSRPHYRLTIANSFLLPKFKVLLLSIIMQFTWLRGLRTICWKVKSITMVCLRINISPWVT